MKGPILHSKDWEYVGVVYPWHVFRPLRPGIPELRYLAYAWFINDEDGSRHLYKRKLPEHRNYVVKF